MPIARPGCYDHDGCRVSSTIKRLASTRQSSDPKEVPDAFGCLWSALIIGFVAVGFQQLYFDNRLESARRSRNAMSRKTSIPHRIFFFATFLRIDIVRQASGLSLGNSPPKPDRRHNQEPRGILRAGDPDACLDTKLHDAIASPSRLSRRRVLSQTAETAVSAFVATRSGLVLPASAAPTAGTKTSIPTISLGSKGNLQISRSIQGYWQLAGGHGKYRETDAVANMAAHCDAGFTTLDTADIYGPSERIIGDFVAARKGRGQQPPPVVCTKFCCFRFLEDIDRAEVRERILRACERLRLPQLPLVQFFWSNYDVKNYVNVALYLAELREEGLIGELGATNFDLPRLQELYKAGVPLVSHQVQLSAMDRRPIQSGMASWCVDNNIKLIGFGTVASGILSNEYLGAPSGPSRQEQTTASLRLYGGTAARFGDWSLVQELLQTMNAVAQQVREDGRCVEANISNIAERYVLDTPGVGAIIIGVRNQEHLAENVRTHSFTLTEAEVNAIDKVVAKRRGPKGDVWDIERGVVS